MQEAELMALCKGVTYAMNMKLMNQANIITFAEWGARRCNSLQEAELMALCEGITYAMNMKLMNAVFWNDCKAIVEGFNGNTAYMEPNLLCSLDRVRLKCKCNPYFLLWSRNLNVLPNMLARDAAKYKLKFAVPIFCNS